MANRRNGKTLETAERICEMINNHQTVAVLNVDGKTEIAPIVRCSDCRFYVPQPEIDGLGYCYGKCGELASVDSDWFCASGERKDGDGDQAPVK